MEVVEQVPLDSMVDISTAYWYTAYEELGLGRCCCDARDGWFDQSERSNRCKLYDGMHGSCSSISDTDFSSDGEPPRSLSGRRHTTSGGCNVWAEEVVHWEELTILAVSTVQDVTTFVDQFSSRDVLCCCDVFPLRSLFDREFAANQTRCGLYLNRNQGECSSVDAIDFTWQEVQQISEFDVSRLHGHASTRMGKCVMNSGAGQIDIMARLVLGAYGPDDYCGRRQMIGDPGQPIADHSPFGRRADILCNEGYEPHDDKTTCEYYSLTQGRYLPALACQPRREHCQTLHYDGGDEHNHSIPATTYNEHQPVTCSTGWEAEVAEVHCRVDEHFNPVPNCSRTAGWCPTVHLEATSTHFQVDVPEARVGLASVVRCQVEFGLVPEYQNVTCGLDHAFSPVPNCVVDTDFCHTVEGTAANGGLTIGQAAFGDMKEVTCGEGFLPAMRSVTCGHEEGVGPHFDPIAECQVDCTSVSTRLASLCEGPSASSGACYTEAGDLKLWGCWGLADEQRSTEWCQEASFAGACAFETPYTGPGGESLPMQDSCTDVTAYDEQCGDHPGSSYLGACFVETTSGSENLEGSWACITGDPRRSDGSIAETVSFRTADCLMKAVPDEVFESVGESTYTAGCVF